MYSVTAYYLAFFTSTVSLTVLYPVLVTLTAFYWFGMDDSSFGAMLAWMGIMTATAFAGGFWGFTLGTFMKNDVTASQINILFIIMFSFGAGLFANTGQGVNFVVQMITYISPMRYCTELLTSRVLEDKPGGEYVMELFGFTWGQGSCITLLIFFAIVCFFGGWLSLLWKTRDF